MEFSSKTGPVVQNNQGADHAGEHLDCEVSIARTVYNGLENLGG